jgi:hypothetical protein
VVLAIVELVAHLENGLEDLLELEAQLHIVTHTLQPQNGTLELFLAWSELLSEEDAFDSLLRVEALRHDHHVLLRGAQELVVATVSLQH